MMPSYRDGWTLSQTDYMLNRPDIGAIKEGDHAEGIIQKERS